MESPLVSIITVVYNNKQGIEKTLSSIVSQTYTAIEYIVIDGGSSDGTLDILSRYQAHISIFISEPDEGIYDAMNKGISLATGELIGIINSGDFYEKDALETVVNSYREHPEAAIFHGVLRVFEATGAFKSIIGNHSSFLAKGMIEHPTCFVKREIFQQHGAFNLAYKSSSDYDFMLRMKELKVSFMFIEKILANYYTGGISFQTTALLETLQIKQHYGLISKFKKVLIEQIISFRAKLKI
ncbi:glycosyltransferase family 2 protein [Pedobacter immunditicola]|uniref:glycosyltransferase family 2 protein n=1 Tax=Pedobacter immunditicola TaxID=3133440 RepID=UPI00309691FF